MAFSKDFVSNALKAKRESKYIDFKERMDIEQVRDWCEIVKDISAMANSGGGCILFGVRNNGEISDWNTDLILKVDPAVITDKINKYTGDQFSDFEIQSLQKDNKKIAALIIQSAQQPLIFIRPGTYANEIGKQGSAFAQGTIYFRHGAKSETGNSKDLMGFLERKIDEIRKSWLGNIRKVVRAPQGHKISILPPNIRESSDPSAVPIRITDDPHAPAYQKLNPNITHPYRQKEVITVFNQKSGGKTINSYDVVCVRKIYHIDDKFPDFFYKPKFASPQYSDGFVNWLSEMNKNDPRFFDNAKEKMKKELYE